MSTSKSYLTSLNLLRRIYFDAIGPFSNSDEYAEKCPMTMKFLKKDNATRAYGRGHGNGHRGPS